MNSLYTPDSDELNEDQKNVEAYDSQEEDLPRNNYNFLLHMALENIDKRSQ